MYNFNLFYTKNDYQISDKHRFPASEVLGFILHPTQPISGMVQLRRVYTIPGVISRVVFNVGTEDTIVATLEFQLTEKINEGRFFDKEHSYCGCMYVSPIFGTWIKSLAGFNLDILPGTILMNPSYCLMGESGHTDCRIMSNGERINTITLTDSYLVSDAQGFHIWTPKGIDNLNRPAVGLEELRFTTNNGKSYVVLKGKSVALTMNPPPENKYNKTYIDVSDNVINFQDAGLGV